MPEEAKRIGEIKPIFPDELKEYLENHEEGTYTLLDVRQPPEFEESRLPGARLMPLPELADSLKTLDRSKPLLVYCSVGARSLVAAQFLAARGFPSVFHLQGGLDAWEETTAVGPEALHLKFLSGGEPPEQVIQVAYCMEEGLRQFHESMRLKTEDAQLGELLDHLIQADESHKRTLSNLLRQQGQVSGTIDLDASCTDTQGNLVEGGVDIQAFLQDNARFLGSVAGYLDLAMMIETQALDLYLRMADGSTEEASRKVLLHISEEEKRHLALLGQYRERLSGSSAPLP